MGINLPLSLASFLHQYKVASVIPSSLAISRIVLLLGGIIFFKTCSLLFLEYRMSNSSALYNRLFLLSVEWAPEGTSPSGSHRTVLKTLASYGSSYPSPFRNTPKQVWSMKEDLPALQLSPFADRIRSCLGSSAVTAVSTLLCMTPPLCSALVLRFLQVLCLNRSLNIGRQLPRFRISA